MKRCKPLRMNSPTQGPCPGNATHTASLRSMMVGEHEAMAALLSCCLLPRLKLVGSKRCAFVPRAKQPAALVARLLAAMDCGCGGWPNCVSVREQ